MAAGTSEDVGKLFLMVAVGFFVPIHSYFKLRHGVGGIMEPLRREDWRDARQRRLGLTTRTHS